MLLNVVSSQSCSFSSSRSRVHNINIVWCGALECVLSFLLFFSILSSNNVHKTPQLKGVFVLSLHTLVCGVESPAARLQHQIKQFFSYVEIMVHPMFFKQQNPPSACHSRPVALCQTHSVGGLLPSAIYVAVCLFRGRQRDIFRSFHCPTLSFPLPASSSFLLSFHLYHL